MMMSATWVAVGVAILVAATAAAAPPEEEAGKRGGIFTYTIPALLFGWPRLRWGAFLSEVIDFLAF